MPIQNITQPETLVIGDDLRLRKYDGSHGCALSWYQDPELVWLVDGVRTPYTPEKLGNMYRYLNNRGELYFIEVREGDTFRPIGDVTFWQEDMPVVIGEPAYRGRGIGRKVIAALVERGRSLGYDELYVNEIYRYNARSRRCFESAGFQVCGETDTAVRLRRKL